MSKEVFTLEAVLKLNDQAFQQGLDSAKSQSSGFKEHLLANLASGAITKAFDTIVGGFQRIAGVISDHVMPAVARLDTMNSYGKTMSALGFSTDEAADAQSRLSDAIDGLPTTLDGIIGWQQQFTALTDDISGATDLTIALNNATLAAGKGQEVANQAMGNWYAIIASGKPDAQHWQSIYSSMPAQVNALAQSLLGADAKSQDLFAAWQSGAITTEQVTAALVDLNENGFGEVSSFADQAQIGAQTIQTAYGNIGTAISRNVANVINVLNGDATDGGGRIVQILLSVKGLINQVGGTISSFVQAHKPEIDAIMGAIQGLLNGDDISGDLGTIFSNVGSMITGVFDNIKTFVENNKDSISATVATVLNSMVQTLITLAPVVIDGIFQMLTFITAWLQDAENVSTLVDGVVQLVIQIANSLATILPVLLPAIFEVIANIATALVTPENINALLGAVWQIILALVQAIWESLPIILGAIIEILVNITATFVGWIANAVSTWGEFFDKFLELNKTLFDAIWQKIQDFFAPLIEFISPILESVKYLFQTIFEAIRITIERVLNGIKNVFSVIWDAIYSKVSTVLNVLKNFVSSVFQMLVNNVSEPLTRLKNAVSNVFETIKSIISGQVGKATTWGKDLIDNFVGGIKSKISKVSSAITNVADTIRSIIGFSEPEDGPLSMFHTFAPDMIDLFTKGLYDNEDMIQEALGDVFQMPGFDDIDVDVPASPRAGAGAGARTFSPTINVYASEGQDVRALAKEVSRELQNLLNDTEAVYA